MVKTMKSVIYHWNNICLSSSVREEINFPSAVFWKISTNFSAWSGKREYREKLNIRRKLGLIRFYSKETDT